MNSACSSLDAEPGPVRDWTSFSCSHCQRSRVGVSVDVTRVGDSVGLASTPVGVALDVTGVVAAPRSGVDVAVDQGIAVGSGEQNKTRRVPGLSCVAVVAF